MKIPVNRTKYSTSLLVSLGHKVEVVGFTLMKRSDSTFDIDDTLIVDGERIQRLEIPSFIRRQHTLTNEHTDCMINEL